MTTQRRTLVANDDELKALREPIDGIVLEQAGSTPDRFDLAEGPFSTYVRTLSVSPGPDARSHSVVEEVTWKLAIPVFGLLYWFPFWWSVRHGQKNPSPWWAPAGRLDAQAANAIGLLGVIAIINGFLGTVIGQTLTFAADEFCTEFETSAEGLRSCIDPDHDTSARGDVFQIVRVSVVLSLGLTVFADRFGRKLALTAATTISCLATAAGALAPSLGLLTASQIISRGLATGLSILLLIFASEELPPKSRAYGVSMLVLLAGLGAGMVVWILPLADVAVWGWRLVYAAALLFVPLALWVGSRLPKTRRFAQLERQGASRSLGELWQDEKLRNRLLLLGFGALLVAIFSTPASQFDNQFLRDELGFSASRITLFTLVTSTPIGIGVLAGGILADRLGRRPIGALGTAIGVTMTTLSFFSSAVWIFPVRAIGVILGSGFAVAGLAVYGPELFPTRLRGTANGVITAFGVGGSVIGLRLVSRLAEEFDAFGPALLVAAIGPALLVLLIIFRYPETANLTLEELNDEAPLE